MSAAETDYEQEYEDRVKKLDREGWVLVGHVDVDSGLVMVGDPAYIIVEQDERFARPVPAIHDWNSFCHTMDADETFRKQSTFVMKHAKGHTGAGVLTRTLNGDGTYPVYARFHEVDGLKRPKELRIIFE